jgi:hypothetical protein
MLEPPKKKPPRRRRSAPLHLGADETQEWEELARRRRHLVEKQRAFEAFQAELRADYEEALEKAVDLEMAYGAPAGDAFQEKALAAISVKADKWSAELSAAYAAIAEIEMKQYGLEVIAEHEAKRTAPGRARAQEKQAERHAKQITTLRALLAINPTLGGKHLLRKLIEALGYDISATTLKRLRRAISDRDGPK